MLETFSSTKFLQLSFSISILFCYKKMIFFHREYFDAWLYIFLSY